MKTSDALSRPPDLLVKAGFALLILFSAAVTVFFIVVAPGLAVYLSRYLFLLCLCLVAFKLSAPSAPLVVRLIFLVVLGDLLLGYGFSNIAVGAGSARVTVVELVLLVSLVAIAFQFWQKLWLAGTASFLLLAYTLVPLFIHLFWDISRYGIVAARDALPLFDAFFFFGGIAVVVCAKSKSQWLLWQHRFFWLVLAGTFLYLPLFPFKKLLLQVSPSAYGYQQSVPIFGFFTTMNVLALSGLLATTLTPGFLAWKHGARPSKWIVGMAFIVFGSGIVMLQSRATYVATFASMIILAMNGHGAALRRVLVGAIAAVTVLLAVEISGHEIKGRVGNIGLDTLIGQLASISGKEDVGAAGAGGISLRKEWRDASLGRWSESGLSVMFGIGFGQTLTNFAVGRSVNDNKLIIVREPHNSYLSVLTRTGIAGLLPWLAFHCLVLMTTWRTYRERKALADAGADYWLWLFLFFVTLLIEALVEPVFESPFFAVPYFFLSGVALAQIARDKNSWR